jgi:hypothetical protein
MKDSLKVQLRKKMSAWLMIAETSTNKEKKEEAMERFFYYNDKYIDEQKKDGANG